MNNEQILKDPQRCIEWLKSVMGREDTLDVFTSGYEYMLNTIAEQMKNTADDAEKEVYKDHLRKMRALLMKQADYLFELRATRFREGIERGMNN
jgi:hypothetical protein